MTSAEKNSEKEVKIVCDIHNESFIYPQPQKNIEIAFLEIDAFKSLPCHKTY